MLESFGLGYMIAIAICMATSSAANFCSDVACSVLRGNPHPVEALLLKKERCVT
jgi:hypothetical protein